jgi:hypothetical protein
MVEQVLPVLEDRLLLQAMVHGSRMPGGCMAGRWQNQTTLDVECGLDSIP